MRRESYSQGTEIPHLDLNGSYVSEIDAKGVIVHGDLNLANGFHASGETRIETARIDGPVNCSGGYSTIRTSLFRSMSELRSQPSFSMSPRITFTRRSSNGRVSSTASRFCSHGVLAKHRRFLGQLADRRPLHLELPPMTHIETFQRHSC